MTKNDEDGMRVRFAKGDAVTTPTGRLVYVGEYRIVRTVVDHNSLNIAEYDERDLKPAGGGER